ncbi:MAG: hypothetical protein M9950_02805 [Thermomicrobiales bacterium]|nr:hypothetical protein [Thermomicrobiales bacterium]
MEHQTIDKGTCGRLETHLCGDCRSSQVIAWLNPAQQWPGLQSIIRMPPPVRPRQRHWRFPPPVPATTHSASSDAVRLNQVIPQPLIESRSAPGVDA